VREALEQIAVPGDDGARDRAHAVVRAAFDVREPVPRHRRPGLVAIAAAAVAALALAVASPPGRAVVDRMREIVGVEHAQPALFSLPGGGRLLVTEGDGVWVVDANGKKRLLDGYDEASWSPFGRFVVATRANELAALEPEGDVRWTLARPGVRSPVWSGSPTDTRIAYLDRTGIRVVAGDGTGDRLLAPAESGPLAWRPGPGHVLAYASASEIRIQDTVTGRVLRRINSGAVGGGRLELEWSTDGRRLLAVGGGSVQVFARRGQLAQESRDVRGGVTDAAFEPGTHRVLVARIEGRQSAVVDLATGRRVFSGTGVFDSIHFSPDGDWLAIEWRTADQWVFVRMNAPRAIRAVSGIAAQFRGQPVIVGWCCAQ
jgi:hypothetical protein